MKDENVWNQEYRKTQLQEQEQETQDLDKQNLSSAKRQSFFSGLAIGLFVTVLVSGILFWHSEAAIKTGSFGNKGDSVLTSDVSQKIMLLEDAIDRQYLHEVTREDLENGLYKGLVSGLDDPYSVYYSAEELQQVRESMQGIFYGIGAHLSVDRVSGLPRIVGVMEGTPAEEAGLQEADLILEVDGEDTSGQELTDVVGKIRGPEHTQVELTIYREGYDDPLKIMVTRGKIEVQTVRYKMLEDGIAHIRITEFDTITPNQFVQAYEKALEEGMQAMVLDLRSNPGGSLQAAVEVAGHFMPNELVVYTEDKKGNRENYNASNKKPIVEVPIVVLINEYSASAAEILAGAIRDYNRGLLLGTTTYGKGVVQQIFELSDNSAVKLTIRNYYTPSGDNIHDVGIAPDEELEFAYEAFREEERDNQLERAWEILRGE